MATLLTIKFKIGSLLPLHNKKLFITPLSLIFLLKEVCKCFFAGPLNLNPFYLISWLRLDRNTLMAIYIIFNLLNISLGEFSLVALNLQFDRNLKPISYFENIPVLKLFIILKVLVVWANLGRILRFLIFPFKY